MKKLTVLLTLMLGISLALRATAQVTVSGGQSVVLASVAAPYTIGDIFTANSTTTTALINDVATGNVLLSGGVGMIPAWGKVALTTHVSGILPVANGGTGVSTGIIARVYGGTGVAVTAPASSTGFGTGVAGVIEAASTDWGGRMTVGTGGDTTGTITFGSTYAAKPHCIAQNETTGAAVKAVAATTTLTLTGTFLAGDKLTWICQ